MVASCYAMCWLSTVSVSMVTRVLLWNFAWPATVFLTMSSESPGVRQTPANHMMSHDVSRSCQEVLVSFLPDPSLAPTSHLQHPAPSAVCSFTSPVTNGYYLTKKLKISTLFCSCGLLPQFLTDDRTARFLRTSFRQHFNYKISCLNVNFFLITLYLYSYPDFLILSTFPPNVGFSLVPPRVLSWPRVFYLVRICHASPTCCLTVSLLHLHWMNTNAKLARAFSLHNIFSASFFFVCFFC